MVPTRADETQTDEAILTLIKEGDYAGAEALALQTLRRFDGNPDPGTLEEARILDLLVEARLYSGKASEDSTKQLAERALAIKEAVLGSDDLALVPSLGHLGSIYHQGDQLEAARPILERAVALQENAADRDPQEYAWSLERLANLNLDQGNYEEARGLFVRELDTLERAFGPEHRSLASVTFNYARLLMWMGEYEASESMYRRALNITEKTRGASHPLVAWVLSGMASVEDEMGEYAKARSLYERALALADSTLDPGHPFIATCLGNLGVALRHLGDYREAARIYERALRLHEESQGLDNSYAASILTNLGEIHRLQGDDDTAENLFKKALDIRERAFGPDHVEVGTTLQLLADLYLYQGKYEAARSSYERALAIGVKNLGPAHHSNARDLNGLAFLLQETGDYEGAAADYTQALEISENSLGSDHPFVAEILKGQALLLARTGDSPAALDAALRCETISRDHAWLAAGVLPEREALEYTSVRTSGLDLALSLAVLGHSSDAVARSWDALVRSRALILDAMVLRQRARNRSRDPEIADLADRLAAAKRTLANLVIQGPDDEHPETYVEQVREARETKERAERALGEKSVSVHGGDAGAAVGLASVKETLPQGSALVAYVRYRDYAPVIGSPGAAREPKAEPVPSYLSVVVGGDGVPRMHPLGPAADIERLVGEWRTLAGHPSPDGEAACRVAGEALRRLIWDPVSGDLGQAAMVFVVPDGVLHMVNLSALPTGDDSYLVEEDRIVHYLSAERDLAELAGDPVTGTGLLVVGGPAFDETGLTASLSGVSSAPAAGQPDFFRGQRSDCEDFRKLRFESLPASTREAAEILDLWRDYGGTGGGGGDADLLTGADAGEASVKALAPGRRVIHIATHGFFLEGTCAAPEESGTRGIGSVSPARRENPRRSESPLLLAGLALAGANHRNETGPDEEDGVLTAEEIGTLDLRGTDWVVLSACDTGIGKIAAGEGVLGLRRAFQTAGARTLIMSLWPVQDVAAREWMRDLYRARLERNLDTASAVREANLEVLRDRRARGESTHPFFWAAFVAAGGWQ